MFEKEAEEYVRKIRHAVINWGGTEPHDVVNWSSAKPEERFYNEIKFKQAYLAGAEFGYNKANEWHKIADGTIPRENKLYLVQIKDNGLAIAYFNGQHWETRYNLGESGHCVETVIAWREVPTLEE